MGAELHTFIEMELVILSDKGAACVVAFTTYILRRRIYQPRLSGSGRLKCWILGVNHRIYIGTAMAMTGLTTYAGHLGSLLDGDKAAHQTVSGGMAGQAGFIVRVVLLWIKPRYLFLFDLLTGPKHIEAVRHPGLFP